MTYPKEFDEELKEEIRERDRRICRICGKHEEDSENKLDIHHRDNNKDNCSRDNLVSLCRSCHTSVTKKSYEEVKEEYNNLKVYLKDFDSTMDYWKGRSPYPDAGPVPFRNSDMKCRIDEPMLVDPINYKLMLAREDE